MRTDSGIIGSQAFVDRIYREFKDYFSSKHEKKPKVIQSLEVLMASPGMQSRRPVPGLWKAAHQMRITPDHFRKWENRPRIRKELESATEKLNQIKTRNQ